MRIGHKAIFAHLASLYESESDSSSSVVDFPPVPFALRLPFWVVAVPVVPPVARNTSVKTKRFERALIHRGELRS